MVGPWMGIIMFSHIFWQVCVKVWNLVDIVNLQEDETIILSLLEKKFPSSFF